jgi:hypothetical protein
MHPLALCSRTCSCTCDVGTHRHLSNACFVTDIQELAQEAESKAGTGGALPDEVTWTLSHLEAAVLQSIGRTPAKNPATNENWPAIKSLADILSCRFNLHVFC